MLFFILLFSFFLLEGLAYWALGWALAYGEGGNPFCGASQFFSYHLPLDYYPIWLFDVSKPLKTKGFRKFMFIFNISFFSSSLCLQPRQQLLVSSILQNQILKFFLSFFYIQLDCIICTTVGLVC
jgi:hypothetical protein